MTSARRRKVGLVVELDVVRLESAAIRRALSLIEDVGAVELVHGLPD